MRILTLVLSAGIAGLSLVAMCSALAGPPETVTVQLADLDLRTVQGAAALYARLKNGAKAVCAGVQDSSLTDKRRFESCISLALANATVRVDRPVLSEAALVDPAHSPSTEPR